MAEDQIRQVMIQGKLIGIAGLDNAISETARALYESGDEEIKKSLLDSISISNYVPSSARDAYGNALLREFKIAQGIPVEQDSFDGLTIAVLGAGCTRCTQLESDIRDLLSEMKIAADLRHITDAKEIARFGVMGAPALVVNNKVVSAGEVPPKSKIRQWIIDACNQPSEVDK